MYRIVQYDDATGTVGRVIYDPSARRSLTGSLTLKENDIDDISLTVDQSSFLFYNATPRKTHIEVWQDDERIFRGRLLKNTHIMSSDGLFQRTFIGEHIMAYLIDSIQPYGVFHNISVESFLGTLLANHNKVVEPYKKINLGRVTVKDSNNAIYRYIGYETTWETINDKLVSRLGGYLNLRIEDDGLYLDYLKEIGVDHDNDTPIQLGRNLKSATSTLDPEEVITRLWPLGKTIETKNDAGNQEASNPRLDIKSVNGGKAYIDDPKLIELYGVVGGTKEYDDVELPGNLLSNGRNFLATQAAARQALSLSAAEIGGRYESFKVHDRYRFLAADVLEPQLIRVTQKKINFKSPNESSLTIGDKPRTATQQQLALKREAKGMSKVTTSLSELTSTTQTLTSKQKTVDETIKKLQLQLDASNAVPMVKLQQVYGAMQIQYTITPAAIEGSMTFMPEISEDMNVWTQGTPTSNKVGIFNVPNAGEWFVRVKATLSGYSSPYSPAARIIIEEIGSR